MNIPILETARPFKMGDVEALFRIANQEDIFKYFPNPEPWTLEKTEKFIQYQLEHWNWHAYGWWGVELLDRPELVGWNGLQYLPDTDEIEVGYLMSRAFQGRGWTTEGVQASLGFAFNQLGIQSIIAIIHPENIASQRVAMKCGLLLVDYNNYFGMDCFRYRIDEATFRSAPGIEGLVKGEHK
jgi:ribosomal-protein-alanine N-acetyltransferase